MFTLVAKDGALIRRLRARTLDEAMSEARAIMTAQWGVARGYIIDESALVRDEHPITMFHPV